MREVPFSCGVVCSKLLTVSGANNSEQYSMLKIVIVPCTNQASLAQLAMIVHVDGYTTVKQDLTLS